MRRDEVLATLREHLPELEGLGVRSLAIFGSVARDEAGPGSDLDVLVDFEGPTNYWRYCDVWFWLQDTFQTTVDLVPERELSPELRPYVERDAIRVA